MRRSTAVRLSILGLALAPLTTACTVTIGNPGKDGSSTAAAATSAAPATTNETTSAPTADTSSDSSSDSDPTTDSTSSTGSDSSSNTSTDSHSPSASSTQGSSATTSGSSQQGSSTAGKRQKIDVPPGSGISNLELIDLYGAPEGETGYGKGVGVFTMTNDRPMMLKLRIQLFDASGKMIAENTGLNSNYTVGSHDWVTKNLIKVPAGARVKSFKVAIVDKADLVHSVNFAIDRLDKPSVGKSSKFDDVPALKGKATFSGKLPSSVDAKGACILPDGRIVQGADSLLDNAGSRSGEDVTVDYEIPLYDAKGMDLSKATCYASV